jgi:hypothetical protein
LRIFINTLLVIVAISAIVARRFRQCKKIFGARSAKVESGLAGQTSSSVPGLRSKILKFAHDLVAKAFTPTGHARGHASADQTQEIINLKN